ncbi:formate/nitrite transporter family protein [Clostridium felsineum]|uniref:Nitrite transporter NirC n=1 Tax=Clostridium felsineum TaxID=36839 RepID=A0A1S8LLC6_9CLOT|nr:formate/nitrite transporter family protein [Clostridium felsineum]URZ06984.1 Nitrite transporter NirC [Clostridium felsineum]URZ12014.1 Nitrite transporter NirC [Clostridium felsineum]
MFEEDFQVVSKAAKTKTDFLDKNLIGYFLAAVLAGMYVGFGVLLIFTIGGMLKGMAAAKIVMGVSFGIALSLVIIAGSELFTGNNMVMTAGMLSKTIKFSKAIKLWIVCFIGNLAGSILLAFVFYGAGLLNGSTAQFIAASVATKMHIAIVPLFLRAILCNILVCLAVWCGFKCKSESGKLIMIFWCLFAFITCGFEHSVANMTLLTLGMLAPHKAAVSLGGYFYNIGIVSLGNMVGAILFVAFPYFIISRKKKGA